MNLHSGISGRDKMVYFTGIVIILFLIGCGCVCYCKTCLGYDYDESRHRRKLHQRRTPNVVYTRMASPRPDNVIILPSTHIYPVATAPNPNWSSNPDCPPPPYSAVVATPSIATTTSHFSNYGAFKS